MDYGNLSEFRGEGRKMSALNNLNATLFKKVDLQTQNGSGTVVGRGLCVSV